jgi:ribosomal protein S18 acetylase RimI-like enzyme
MSSHEAPLPPVIVRPATPADAEAIDRIEQASFAYAGERFNLRRIRYLLGTHRTTVMVAEIDGRVVGWVAGMVGGKHERRWGRIYALAVHPDGRGRKLGARLLKEMIAILRSRSAGRIFLEVRADNHSAIKLYERAGFVPGQTLPNYYGNGINGLRMDLGASARA